MFVKSIVVGALAALAAAQSAAISFTNPLPQARVGQSLELTWQANDASAPVTILLRKGDANNLQTVSTLTSSATGGKYEWTPASDLAPGSDYALQITQGSNTNYLGPFSISGGTGTASSSSSPAASPAGYSTVSAPVNSSSSSSQTVTALPPYATGNATTPRNTTMTLKPTGSNPDNTNGAGFQGSETGSNAPKSTGGASSLLAGGSSVALALGAVAAVLVV
ncbi:extracellular matrix protein [Cercospora zeina]